MRNLYKLIGLLCLVGVINSCEDYLDKPIDTDLSVNEVFTMTGFKSRTHFTKVFKEKYNTSPGKYATESKQKTL